MSTKAMLPSEALPGSRERSPRASSPGNDSDICKAARRSVEAAQAAHRAASADHNMPAPVKQLTAQALDEALAVLQAVENTPKRQRQTIAEFTSMLGEEAQEVAQETVAQVKSDMDEVVRYAERNIRKAYSCIEDHWAIDEAFRMLGPLRQDSNFARDVHDIFNLVALLPVIYLNLKNWSRTSLYVFSTSVRASPNLLNTSLPALWHGDDFQTFWWITFLYFITDFTFICVLPHSVKSPKVIITHHIAATGYIGVPKLMPEYGWLMGACMIVEVNSWFLIARRFFNKQGDRAFSTGVPTYKSLQILLVSSCFYVTWFAIRLGFYPYLFCVIVFEWIKYTRLVGTPLNIVAMAPVFQAVFVYLNIKWSVDLIRSKVKGRGHSKGL